MMTQLLTVLRWKQMAKVEYDSPSRSGSRSDQLKNMKSESLARWVLPQAQIVDVKSDPLAR